MLLSFKGNDGITNAVFMSVPLPAITNDSKVSFKQFESLGARPTHRLSIAAN